jgi:hypothetical protein
MFETSAGNKLCAEGDFFYHQATFFVFAECTDPPHQPLIYAFRDPLTAEIMSLNGVSIVPHSIGPNMGSPLMRLVYVWRDGVPRQRRVRSGTGSSTASFRPMPAPC